MDFNLELDTTFEVTWQMVADLWNKKLKTNGFFKTELPVFSNKVKVKLAQSPDSRVMYPRKSKANIERKDSGVAALHSDVFKIWQRAMVFCYA